MTKLLVMTDIHILAAGGTIIGLDPSVRFRAVLDRALQDHADAAHLILTGDLTHHGRPGEYAELKRLLAEVPVPITFLLGNHDDRRAFRAAFPEVSIDPAGFVQSVIDTETHRLICLDTLHPDTAPYHAGHLCAARLAWLEAQLGNSPAPCVIFQHHPPMAVGFPGMDAIKLDNGPAEISVLRRHDVAHLVAGHVHRTISGTVNGLSYTIFKSPCHQMPLHFDDTSSSVSVDEPGAFGIVLLQPDALVVHSEDVGLPREILRDTASAG